MGGTEPSEKLDPAHSSDQSQRMDAEQVRRVRSFNRAVSQRIGALDDSFLGRGRPLGEARLLYEIGHEGAEVRTLRARLGLDSGYLSRLLRSLERQGLVRAKASAQDGRVRRVALTAKGGEEVAELDRRSDTFARSLLAPLGRAQQTRLMAAMTEVERLIQAAAVQFAPEAADSPAARGCLEAYFRELAARFESGFDPARSIAVRPEELRPPAGVLVLAWLDGRAVGCGAMRVKPGAVGEIKRMWVASEVRGLGVGRRLLTYLEGCARGLGVGVLRLDTNRRLAEAQALYRACGYRDVPPFNDEPYAHHWFEKRLG